MATTGGAAGSAAARVRRRPSWHSVAAAASLAALLTGCADDEGIRDDDGAVVNAGVWSVFDLRGGDCLDPDPDLEGEVSEIAVVPCDEPHAQEVFATIEHPEGAYPGAGAVSLWADGACLAELESDLGLTLDDGVFVTYLLPTFVGWNKDDDRRVVCALVFPDRGDATGSVVAGTADIEPATPLVPQLTGAEPTTAEETT